MALSDQVRKGIVQADATSSATRGAYGILFWEVVIFACIVGNFLHSGLIGWVIFLAYFFCIGPYPLYTLGALSLIIGIVAYVAHMNGAGQPIGGFPLWFESIGIFIMFFIFSLIVNGLLYLFSLDLM